MFAVSKQLLKETVSQIHTTHLIKGFQVCRVFITGKGQNKVFSKQSDETATIIFLEKKLFLHF